MKEIERKYKITKEQFNDIIKKSFPEFSTKIFQGYFFNDDPDREYRIRAIKTPMSEYIPDFEFKYFLTIKNKNTGNRIEHEVQLTKESAKDLLNHCTKFINKTRYLILWENENYLEVDVYNDDLIIVEIEFDDEEKFKNLKKEKGGLDFNDLERYTLEILKHDNVKEEFGHFLTEGLVQYYAEELAKKYRLGTPKSNYGKNVEFDVELTEAGANKIKVITALSASGFLCTVVSYVSFTGFFAEKVLAGEITISQLFNMDGIITSLIANFIGEVILFTLDGAFFAVMFLLLGICLWSISVMIVNYSDEKEKQMKKAAKSK